MLKLILEYFKVCFDSNKILAVAGRPQLTLALSCSYFYQITMGCGTVHCTNRNCFACPDGPRLDPTSAALLAVKLAQSPTHYLCAGAAITVPQSLQWVEVPANADVVPLRKILGPALEASNVQAQACSDIEH